MSQSTDFGSRVIAGSFGRTSLQSIPASTTTVVELETEAENSGGLDFNSSTGVITVLESGYYSIFGQTSLNDIDDGDRNICFIYINAVIASRGYAYSAGSNLEPTASADTIRFLVAGDEVTLRVFSDNPTARNVTADATRTYLNIHKIQSPQTLMGGEVVAARYTTDAGQVIPDNTTTIVNFEDKDFDTHNAVTTGASWVFTAPISGFYNVTSKLIFAGESVTVNDSVRLALKVNTVDGQVIGDFHGNASGTYSLDILGSGLVELNAGDTLSVTCFNNAGGSHTLVPTGTRNWVAINKVN